MAHLAAYLSTFNPQRLPSYAVKVPGGTWSTRQKALADPAIRAHLRGDYAVAAVGSWYPSFAAVDLDGVEQDRALRIQAELGLDGTNSMLCESESADSYHILFRPVYGGRPPTTRLLCEMFRPYARMRGVEIYPQKKRPFRLPFGAGQRPLGEYGHLQTLKEILFWWGKLDEVELAETVPQAQLPLPLSTSGSLEGWTFEKGMELFEQGLCAPGSRHEAQFQILYCLWRQNHPMADAVHICYTWIRTRHNGFSADILRSPMAVRREIERQAGHIWSRYDMASLYPDATHNGHHGYLTRGDLHQVVRAAGGSLPRMRFLAELVRYVNPRRHRETVAVHSDLLVGWGSKKTYLRYLGELEAAGVLERGSSYRPGQQAKRIRLRWQRDAVSEVIASDGRSCDFVGALQQAVPREQFRAWLKEEGLKKSTVSKMETGLYGKNQKLKKVETL